MKPFHKYQNKWVGDLAWAIGSDSLIHNKIENEPLILLSDWHKQRSAECQEWLRKLDNDPLEINEWMSISKDRRLGSLFERLLEFWLRKGPGPLEFICKGLQIIHEKNTLGEFDFIVFNKETKEYWNIEVAVKFYIGIENQCSMDEFVGPRVIDRLGRKWRHLIERQTRLHQNQQAQAITEPYTNGNELIPKLFVKGRLYVPAEDFLSHKNSNHLVQFTSPQDLYGLIGGWWMSIDQLYQYDNPYKLKILRKLDYFGPLTLDIIHSLEEVSKSQIEETLISKPTPIMVAMISPESDQEISRGWITPNGWPSCQSLATQ